MAARIEANRAQEASKDRALVGVALAAGLGTRLQPLTETRPKASLPFGPHQKLIDVALSRLQPFVATTAVTISASSASLVARLPPEVLVVDEGPHPLGTTLGVVNAQRHVGGHVLMTATDTWYSEGLEEFVGTWDGERIRLLMSLDLYRHDYLNTWRFTGNALIPSEVLATTKHRTGDIVADLFDHHFAVGALDLWFGRGQFIDCGTPHDLWAANMIASRGSNVVEGDTPEGADVRQSVVLDGAVVTTGESVHNSIVGPGFRWAVVDEAA